MHVRRSRIPSVACKSVAVYSVLRYGGESPIHRHRLLFILKYTMSFFFAFFFFFFVRSTALRSFSRLYTAGVCSCWFG